MNKVLNHLRILINSSKESASKDKVYKIKSNIEKEIEDLSNTMENIHTVNKYRQIYKAYKKDTNDKSFFNEHKSEIILYEKHSPTLKNLILKCQVLKIF